MHPKIREMEPGLCPICGMGLVPARNGHTDHSASDKHAGHKTDDFLKKFRIALTLTIPVVLFSPAGKFFGLSLSETAYAPWVSLALGSIVFFYGGLVFLRGAWLELRARAPGMMTLIGVAITVAYLASLAAVFFGFGEALFWELTTLITVMLLGHWLEMRSVGAARGALSALSELLPDTAEIVEGETAREVPVSELRIGNLVRVRPGSRVPADGVVERGLTEVNESLLTGESRPVPKERGSSVIAGTENGDGAIDIRVAKIGEETFLSGIRRLILEAERSKSKLQLLSDRAAYWLTVLALGTGAATVIVWVLLGRNFGFALERSIAVLVVACPHALGLAIPLVASISTTMAANRGFLVKRRMALEAARDIDTVVFDKTGTLTKGAFQVEQIFGNDLATDQVLKIAAALEAHSEHPIARAVAEAAHEKGHTLPEAEGVKRLPGRGVEGTIEGVLWRLGNLSEESVPREWRELGGKTVVYLLRNDEPVGAIALSDALRFESIEAVRELQAMGVSVSMITGDAEDVAADVARELGITEYFSRVLPGEKAAKVESLKSRGRKIAMVGDGVNDAPALAAADLGIAIGAGTTVAIESAGIILIKNDPRDIAAIIRLSRRTYKKMIQNLFWATGYNVIAIPLAAGVLAAYGLTLTPALSAFFMSLSTVIVAANAMMLRRARF